MLDDTLINRRIICFVIAILRGYGPFCLACTAWVLLATAWPPLSLGRDNFLQNRILWILWMPEAVFYIYFLVHAQTIQRAAIHPPKRTREERTALFEKVHSEVRSPEKFFSGWFRGARLDDIGRDEMRRFLDWAFWEGRLGEAAKQGDELELEEYMQKVESMMSRPLVKGQGNAKSLRLTLDPIEIEPRSLAWYSLMGVVDTITIILLTSKGYEYHRRGLPGMAAVFPPRPAALLARKQSAVRDFSYFLRPHTSKTRLPVVWLHGIGIGLLSHVAFLEELHLALNGTTGADDQVGILAIEIIQISSRLTTALPRRAAFVSQFTTMVDTHFGSGRFVLASHSYSSVFSTHALNDPQLSSRISAALLLDPVTILLHMPDVAYNFTVRQPVRANEWLLWYFASKDPQIAHILGRHFFWSENVLWKDRIDHLIASHSMRITVSLCSDDLIVNTAAVRAYLTRHEIPVPKLAKASDGQTQMELQIEVEKSERDGEWSGSGLDVMWWEGYDHAEVFDHQKDRAKLVEILVQYVHNE